MVSLVLAMASSLVSPRIEANDRLPQRLRPAYAVAQKEAQRYARYILEKVWGAKLPALRAQGGDAVKLREKADALVDEAVHLILPYSTRLVQDVLFGTRATHLRITMPDRRKLVPTPGSPAAAALEVAARMSDVAERDLNDRIEQALTEELEDGTQRAVEARLGLPVRGRPRGAVRPLPAKWESAYAAEAREEVVRYVYWWLRKRQRLNLTNLARTHTQEALDRVQNEGPVWGLISAAGYEAWAMNRLRIDFRWGRFNWEIDRRRLRRRMDQDLARGTWALAKLVRELTSPRTEQEIERALGGQIAKALSQDDLRKLAEQYPHTRKELEKRLAHVKRSMGPVFDHAMDRVKLPPDMHDLAREHGRRYMREELDGPFARAVQAQAAAVAAARRVRERMATWVNDSLSLFDCGADCGSSRSHQRALDHVRGEVRPRIQEEVESTLRDAGLEPELEGRGARERAIRDVVEQNGLGRDLDREVERQLKRSER